MELFKKYPSLLNWISPALNLDQLLKIQASNQSIAEMELTKINSNFTETNIKALAVQVKKSLQQGADLICPLHQSYPKKMKFVFLSPTPLLVQGVWPLNALAFSVVGSRKITTDTKFWMRGELGSYLGKNKNLKIVSGGAYGVDQEAHNVALIHGVPTVCIVPAGINNIYPSNLKRLANKILLEQGTVIFPFPPDFPIYRSNFYYRNRILVLLSDCILVAQAQRRSGSMMTATLASEYGVPLYTLPQAPRKGNFGCLDLIEKGVPFLKDQSDLSKVLNRSYQEFNQQLSL